VVEGGDRGDDPDGFEDGEGASADARRRQPHRHFPAGHGAQLAGRDAHGVDGAIGLDQGVRQRLAALAGDLFREMLAPVLDQPREPGEDLDALMGFQPCVAIGEDLSRGLQLALQRRGVVGTSTLMFSE
jgi:hypothetical protein